MSVQAAAATMAAELAGNARPNDSVGLEFISCGAAKSLIEQVFQEFESFNLFVEGELGAGKLDREFVIKWHVDYVEFQRFYSAESDISMFCLDAVSIYNQAETWQKRLRQWHEAFEKATNRPVPGTVKPTKPPAAPAGLGSLQPILIGAVVVGGLVGAGYLVSALKR